MPAKASKRAHTAVVDTVASAAKRSRSTAAPVVPAQSTGTPLLRPELDTVADALCRVPNLPPSIAKMLGRMIPKSLGEPENARHRHQQRVVEMVRLSLDKVHGALQDEIMSLAASSSEAAKQLQSSKEQVAIAQEVLAEKQDEHLETAAKSAEDSAGLRIVQIAVDEAKQARQKSELRLNIAKESAILLKNLAELGVNPWKAGTLQASVGLEWSEAMLVMQERFKFDASVTVAAKAVFAKGPDACRSSFDTIVMDELEARIALELQSLDAELHESEGISQEHEAAMKAKEFECESLQTQHQASSESVAVSHTAIKSASGGLIAAQQAAQQSTAELCQLSSALKGAEGRLTSFQKGAQQAFNELDKRVVCDSV